MDDLKDISTVKILSPSSGDGDATIPIKYIYSHKTYILFDSVISYRTLSIHVDEKPNVTDKKAVGPSDVIREIDVHIIDHDQVFHRFSTHPKLGLEYTAVERKSKDGKNIISPPPTQ